MSDETPDPIPAAAPAPAEDPVQKGHAIIDNFLTRAKELGAAYPAIKLLIPAIGACLHDLFAHMAASQNPAVQEAAKLGDQAAATVASDAEKAVEGS